MRCLFTIALLCLSSTSWASPALDQPYLLTGVAGPVVVYGVTPGAPVALLASATTNGPRYCPAAIAPTCADLRGTTYILATQRADAFGRTTFWVSAPPALHTVYLQAVAHEGGAFTLSPARAAPVLRGDRDADGDGLSNADELIAWGTSPAARDSDGDALDDGAEVMVWGTDPNNPDTDGGGVADGEEVLFQHTDPNAWYDDIDRWSRDSDGDGLYDGEEQDVWGTDPFSYDSDGDGLGDGDEVVTYATDPRLWDTDGGGVPDGEEIQRGTNPRDGWDD